MKLRLILLLSITFFLLLSTTTLAVTVQYSYDNLNRLTRIERPDGTKIEFEYDASGNRTRMLVAAASIVSKQTLEVGDSGYDYTSIQPAIDEAYDEATILVHDGIYAGPIDFNGKSITLKSENGPDKTILDGNGQGPVVSFHSDSLGSLGISNKPVLDGFTVRNGTGIYGGGIYCDVSTFPVITNNKIIGNSADYGGGVYCKPGSFPTITKNIIAHNSALHHGGGIYSESAAPIIRNNNIFKNSAGENGGAIASYQNSSPMLWNNTLTQNTATDHGAGIYSDETSSPSITNTILWDSDEELAGIDPNSIHYSNIKGEEALVGRNSNISQSPSFVGPDQDNYHLKLNSPCKNSGNPDKQYNDLDGSRNDMGADGGPNGVEDTLIPLIEEIQATPQNGKPPLQVTFISKASDEWGIAYYSWDFDDADGMQIDSNQQSPIHLFEISGAYIVTLKVTDNGGLSNTATIKITAEGQGQASPTISSVTASPQSGQAPLFVDFSATAQDQDGSIVNYRWDFDGDGIYDWENESTGDITHTFVETGKYQAQICVIDNDGLKDVHNIPITVVPESCVIKKMEIIGAGMAADIKVDDSASDLNKVKITIPSNALPSDTVITISEVQGCPALPPGTASIGFPVDFGPNGIQFTQPVTISIPYNQDQLMTKVISDPHQLKMYYYSTSESYWKNIPIKSVDMVNQLILAEVTHFTIFQLGSPAETKAPDNGSTGDNDSSSGKGGRGCFIKAISY